MLAGAAVHTPDSRRSADDHKSVRITAVPVDLKLCRFVNATCRMSLQIVESEGTVPSTRTRKKERENRDDLRSENCSIDMIRVEEDQLVLLELGP